MMSAAQNLMLLRSKGGPGNDRVFFLGGKPYLSILHGWQTEIFPQQSKLTDMIRFVLQEK